MNEAPKPICPKCGIWRKPGAVECPACGVIFARLKSAVPEEVESAPAPSAPALPEARDGFILRRFSLRSDRNGRIGKAPPRSQRLRSRLAWIGAAVTIAAIAFLGATGALFHPPQAMRQRRAMREIRFAYERVQEYARGGSRPYPSTRSVRELAAVLEKEGASRLPDRDPWGNEYRYESTGSEVAIASAGADGRWEELSLFAYLEQKTGGVDADIVFRDGRFVRSPR